MGGIGRNSRRARPRAAALALSAGALSLAAAGCGSSSPPPASTSATYHVQVLHATLPTNQQLGQTSLLRLAMRNASTQQIPALTVTVSLAGLLGRASMLPFAIRYPQPGLALPDRPVWVLAQHFPKLAGTVGPGGAQTANPKTFNFGALAAGASAEAIWKLSAVRAGRYTIVYKIAPSLSGEGRAVGANGALAGGTFTVGISSTPPNTTVTPQGKVVVIPGHSR